MPYNTTNLLHNLEQTAGDIGFYVNANKTVFKFFKPEGSISSLN